MSDSQAVNSHVMPDRGAVSGAGVSFSLLQIKGFPEETCEALL